MECYSILIKYLKMLKMLEAKLIGNDHNNNVKYSEILRFEYRFMGKIETFMFHKVP